MKVLFAVSNESISESIIKKYQQEYKEIISSKNVLDRVLLGFMYLEAGNKQRAMVLFESFFELRFVFCNLDNVFLLNAKFNKLSGGSIPG